MYSITEFSRICKMSTRMLRHYDKEEILKPAFVDPINGYRYYESSQLERALKIKKLREYKFSLPKIKLILQSSNQRIVTEYMQSQINELSNEVRQNLHIISEMKEIIHKNSGWISNQYKQYDILTGIRNEVSAITQRVHMNILDMDEHFEFLYEQIKENNFQIEGSPAAIFYDEEYLPEESDIEIVIPIIDVKCETISEQWQIKKLVKHQMVTTVHFGSYDNIGYGYMALEEWIKKNGYTVDAEPYEIYLKGPECDCLEAEYVTQICYSVIKIEQ